MRVEPVRGLLPVLAVLTLCAFGIHAADAPATKPMVNPEYAYWAKFKPGSTRSHTSTSDGPPGMKVISTTTMTLATVDKYSVTLEVVSTMQLGDGKPSKSPVDKWTVKSTLDAATTYAAAGKEELTVDGKKYECIILDKAIELNKEKITLKTWWSDAVPGGMVKMVASGSYGATTTLTSFTAK